MTTFNSDDISFRGAALIQLRHGLLQSVRLAEQLAADALVGHEVLALLGRLHAIATELDDLAKADPRRAHNDPFWSQAPNPFRLAGSSQSAM